MSSGPNPEQVFDAAIGEHLDVVRQVQQQKGVLLAIAQAMTAALRAQKKIMWCGNGGSAGDSQHLAAELVGRFRRERRGFASIALTTDTSILTSVANDYGYEAIFARQVEALGVEGDLLAGLSTSGNSQNVLAALRTAREHGITTVAFTGAGGGKSEPFADHLFAVSSRDTARIQEAHILAGHLLCDWVELDLLQTEAAYKAANTAVRSGELL